MEIDFLKVASELLRKGEITFPQAKQAGRDFLSLLPFSSEDDAQNKIKSFCDKNPKFEKEYAILLTYIDEERTADILHKLRQYIYKGE